MILLWGGCSSHHCCGAGRPSCCCRMSSPPGLVRIAVQGKRTMARSTNFTGNHAMKPFCMVNSRIFFCHFRILGDFSHLTQDYGCHTGWRFLIALFFNRGQHKERISPHIYYISSKAVKHTKNRQIFVLIGTAGNRPKKMIRIFINQFFEILIN